MCRPVRSAKPRLYLRTCVSKPTVRSYITNRYEKQARRLAAVPASSYPRGCGATTCRFWKFRSRRARPPLPLRDHSEPTGKVSNGLKRRGRSLHWERRDVAHCFRSGNAVYGVNCSLRSDGRGQRRVDLISSPRPPGRLASCAIRSQCQLRLIAIRSSRCSAGALIDAAWRSWTGDRTAPTLGAGQSIAEVCLNRISAD